MTPRAADLLYTVVRGTTGFEPNVARAKCRSRCGGEEESLNRILERLNSPGPLADDDDYFSGELLAGICHREAQGIGRDLKYSERMCVSAIHCHQSPLFFFFLCVSME